ncbi:MAG: GNAT family N-acetyltransferase [Rubrivivax sp.]|nr:GNAT family N-acetyltransferase [Rubrivivax sp.]
MDADIVELTETDIADALALSMAAHWNQNAADWATMLRLGQGWGIRTRGPDGRPVLAASTLVLPYGAFAWISMVLVLPSHRGQGLAARLLRHALAWLAERGTMPVLDATPAGRPVYLRHGFVDTWGFVRHRREAVSMPATHSAAPRTRALTEADWPAVAALDAPTFGADRLPLLRALARRLPAAARVLDGAQGLRGFVLGRDGREASQIGPLVAADDEDAKALLGDALAGVGGAVYADLCDHRDALLPWLRGQGFVMQRPFKRMVHGKTAGKAQAPGDATPCVLVAGPELG